MTGPIGICIVFPFRIASEGNRRDSHWGARSKRTKDQRSATKLAVTGHLKQRGVTGADFEPVLVSLTRIAPGRLDQGNIQGAFKAIQDGICDAIGIDDRYEDRIRFRYDQQRGMKGEYGVRVLIEKGVLRERRHG